MISGELRSQAGRGGGKRPTDSIMIRCLGEGLIAGLASVERRVYKNSLKPDLYLSHRR